ncbi:hypothetical protein [Fluviicola taffensis]|uniref:hypothetical protein n=1 Tax=Fluviicola taffensis TaxID=191579 RepID=UPI003137BA78
MNQENKHIIDDLELTPIQLPSDSYFEELKKSILKEIGNDGLKKKEEPRIISMYKRWYVWGSAAAILAFAILLSWNNTHTPTESESINLSSVSNEEIYDYLNENIEDLDSETIAVHLSDEAVAQNEDQTSEKEPVQATEDFSSKSTLLDHVEDQEILDYLKDESGELDEYLLIES